MSKKALDGYDKVRDAQLEKNEARRLRTKVNDARGNPYDAAARWPFELLQNALDAGPRAAQESVRITFREEPSALVFEHDGAFFGLQDLAALLSGGSNKGFDDAETTGRFGTGFLVTHVLAPRVQLTGLLDAAGQTEQVDLRLDRSGDEDAIVRNMKECRNEIERAVPLASLDNAPSARFVYGREDSDSMRDGLRMFHDALPYLFGTCRLLRSARIEQEGITETWEGGPTSSRSDGDFVVHEREIRVVEREARMSLVPLIADGPSSTSHRIAFGRVR